MHNPNQMEPQVAELFPTPASFTSLFVVLAHFLLGKEFLLMLNTLRLDSLTGTSNWNAFSPRKLLFRSAKQRLESFVSNLLL